MSFISLRNSVILSNRKGAQALKQSSRVTGSQVQRQHLRANRNPRSLQITNMSTAEEAHQESRLPKPPCAPSSEKLILITAGTVIAPQPSHPHQYGVVYNLFTEQPDFNVCRCMRPDQHHNAHTLETTRKYCDKSYKSMTWEETQDRILNKAGKDHVTRECYMNMVRMILHPECAAYWESCVQSLDWKMGGWCA
jgi:hypothetical protein